MILCLQCHCVILPFIYGLQRPVFRCLYSLPTLISSDYLISYRSSYGIKLSGMSALKTSTFRRPRGRSREVIIPLVRIRVGKREIERYHHCFHRQQQDVHHLRTCKEHPLLRVADPDPVVEIRPGTVRTEGIRNRHVKTSRAFIEDDRNRRNFMILPIRTGCCIGCSRSPAPQAIAHGRRVR